MSIKRYKDGTVLLTGNDANNFLMGIAIKNTPEEKRWTVDRDNILPVISEHFHIPIVHILGKEKCFAYVYPRQLLQYILFTKFHYQKIFIGRVTNRDYTTIINSVRVIKGYLDVNESVRQDLAAITKKLNSKFK